MSEPTSTSQQIRTLNINDLERIERFRRAGYGGAIADVLLRLGVHNTLLSLRFRPLRQGMQLAGRALPIKGHSVVLNNMPPAEREAFEKKLEAEGGHPQERMMQAIAQAENGVILCYDTGGDMRIGHEGEMTCQLAYAQGCRGMLVAGNLRDTQYIIKMPDFPVFSFGACPFTDIDWIITEINRPIYLVKANQPQLLQDLQDWFDTEVELSPGMGCPPKDFRSATIPNKGHGRIEVRTLTSSSQLNDFLDWPFLQQVFRLERRVTIQKTGKTRCEVTYGITSLSAEEASPDQLLLMLKSYWQLENGLHYRRDVTLHEDHTRFTKRSAAHNMAIINNIVLALITKANHRLVPSARRFFAAHPAEAISLLL